MCDYHVVLTDLTVIRNDCRPCNLRDQLTDLYLEHSDAIDEIVLKLGDTEIVCSNDDYYVFDIRVYVVIDKTALRVAKFHQDIRDFIHRIEDYMTFDD